MPYKGCCIIFICLTMLILRCSQRDDFFYLKFVEPQLESILPPPAPLCTMGVIETTKTFSFADPSAACSWGAFEDPDPNANWPAQETRISARIESWQEIAIPKDHLICSLEISSPTQTMIYDDDISIVVRSSNFTAPVILAASQDYSKANLRTINGYVMYEWERLRGTFYSDLQYPQYCLGSSGNGKCLLPPTNQTGSFQITYDKDVMIPLGNISAFGVIASGDNDPSDCRHGTFAFELIIRSEPRN